jgi:hypothetical protein
MSGDRQSRRTGVTLAIVVCALTGAATVVVALSMRGDRDSGGAWPGSGWASATAPPSATAQIQSQARGLTAPPRH